MKKVTMLLVVMCFALCSMSFAQTATNHKEPQKMGQQTKHSKHHKHHKHKHKHHKHKHHEKKM